MLVLLSIYIFSFAQPADSTAYKAHINFNYHYGNINNNIAEFTPINPGNISMFEINVSKQTRGEQYWHKSYFYPEVGVSCVFGNISNKEEMGKMLSILPTFTLTSIEKKGLKAFARLGMGLSYFTKHYDRINNPDNLFMGSAIAAHVMIQGGMRKYIAENWSANAQLAFSHHSNGHIQVPNFGINIVSYGLGITYHFTDDKKPVQNPIMNYANPWLFNVRLGMGIHEFAGTSTAIGGPKYPVFVSSLYMSKRYTAASNFHAGLHFNYYASYYDFIVQQAIFDDHKRLNASNVILFVGQEFLLGHFSFVLQAGFNIYNPYNARIKELGASPGNISKFLGNYVTNKLGFQYYFKNPKITTQHNLFMGLFIKTHLAQADFIEYGVGYTF